MRNFIEYLFHYFYICGKIYKMKYTPLTQLHIESGARMVEFAGFLMPVEYSGVTKENLAVRNSAGIFDVSHMGEFWVKGPKALALLQYTTTNDVSALHPGQAQYSCFPNGKGGIVDDLIIYRYSNDKYLLVVNASNMEKDWLWLVSNNSIGAELENASDKIAQIAIQGPKAGEILLPLVSRDISTLKSFEFATTTVAGVGDVIVSATGYTGAGGYEIYCYNEGAVAIWEALVAKGSKHGLIPAGLAARDTLRLEMGYSLYGNDIDDTTSPIEAGLSWIVKLNKGSDFIDRELYSSQKSNGVSRKLVGFEMIDRGIPRKDYTLTNANGIEIGRVTSGTMSPTLQKGIGMAYVKADETKAGNEIFLQVRNKSLKAQIVKFPFIKK
jgi:aminomethyltransferase